jgi:hypothetical protein
VLSLALVVLVSVLVLVIGFVIVAHRADVAARHRRVDDVQAGDVGRE